jgi:hypothetical protein
MSDSTHMEKGCAHSSNDHHHYRPAGNIAHPLLSDLLNFSEAALLPV